MAQKKQFRSQELRIVLIVLLLVVLVGGAGVFYLGLNIVRDYSTEVNQRLADADASEQQVSELMVLRDQLSNSESLVSKANQIFATPDNYQSQAMLDIQRYANASGLSLSKTEFELNAENPTAAVAVVSINSPVSYAKLIEFLNNIEGNIPKMQVSSLSLSKAENPSGGSINVRELKISISVQ